MCTHTQTPEKKGGGGRNIYTVEIHSRLYRIESRGEKNLPLAPSTPIDFTCLAPLSPLPFFSFIPLQLFPAVSLLSLFLTRGVYFSLC